MTAEVLASGGPAMLERMVPVQKRILLAAGEGDFGKLLESVAEGFPGEPRPEAGEDMGEAMEASGMEVQQAPSPLGLFAIAAPKMLQVEELEGKPPQVGPEHSLTQLLVASALPQLADAAAAADPVIAGGATAPANENHPLMAGEPQPGIFIEVTPLSASPGKDEDMAQAKQRPPYDASAMITEREPSGVDDLRPPAAAEGSASGLPDVAPALQIISKLSELTDQASAASSPLSAPQSLRMAGHEDLPRPELRALRLRLQPEELGDVEVTLRRAGQETKVLIAVSSKAAAEQLSRDLTLLEDRLGSLLTSGAGQTVSVSLQSQDTGAMLEQAPPGAGPFTSGGAAPQGGRDSASDGRPGPDRQSPPYPLARNDRHEEDRRSGTPAPGIRIV